MSADQTKARWPDLVLWQFVAATRHQLEPFLWRGGRGRPNSDTGGEFPSEADRPEPGQDGTPWARESRLSDAPDEFATSVNSRVTSRHLALTPEA